MLRLFVGLPVPETAAHAITACMGGLEGARWVSPENLHLTLRFIGDVDEAAASDIDAALGQITGDPVEISTTVLGHFGSGRTARNIWLGVDHDHALEHLQAKIERCLQMARLEPEHRKFLPHVTLARFPRRDGPSSAAVEHHTQNALIPPRQSWRADHFTLFESQLGKGQPRYLPMADYSLTGA
ncbi:MAG: RNA 2',3'-cyclic phosphodiesterase [Alphaproteobacteria bacterium]|nr:RNA 2',3'-cyclic phosphodiesterase [Alphaproteobacteria bacterium SS10]